MNNSGNTEKWLPVFGLDGNIYMKKWEAVLKRADIIKNMANESSINKLIDDTASPLIKVSVNSAFSIINSCIFKTIELNTLPINMSIQILRNELCLIDQQGIKDKVLFPLRKWCESILKWDD